MQVHVLGPLEVVRDGHQVDLGGRKQRALLGLLVAANGRPVSVERLVDQLWDDDPPAKVMASLQAYVANLRRLLEPEREARAPASVLVTRAPGYALVVPAGAVDAEAFAREAAQGRELVGSDPGRARDLLVTALSRWRGDAYADLSSVPALGAEAQRLASLRLGVIEDRWGAELAAGAAASAVPELEALVAEHPVRERLWELLARALYATQRQAEALQALRRARHYLVDELGLDPSPQLRRLEEAVLAQDASLEPGTGPVPVPGEPGRAVLADRATDGDVALGLVGRTAALDALDDVLARARSGHGRLVLVSGEPGIGKTRLAETAVARALAGGMRCGWGGWDAEDGTPALRPWASALEDLGVQLPDLTTGPSQTLDGESSTFQLADSVAATLQAIGSPTGSLLVLDDLHWADPDSLRLLRRLAALLPDLPAVVVATTRTAEAEISPSLAQTLASLARTDPLRIPLDGLDVHDVAAYVRDRTGVDVDDAMAAAVAERTDGNPFYVSELVRLLASEGVLTDLAAARRLDVPHGVRDVVRLRLAQLPEGSEAVLATAAVVGRSFDLDVVEDAAQSSPDDTDAVIEAALMSGLVEEDPRTPGRYRFAHALVRESVYGWAAGPRRARTHARVAQALERRRVGHIDAHLSELAQHYHLAGPTHARSAWTFAARAATLAEQQTAYDESARLYEIALDAVAADPLATGPERYRLLCGLGKARHRMSRVAEAWEPLEQAAELALSEGDAAAAARAALLITDHAVWTWRGYQQPHPAAIALWHRIERQLPPSEGELRARVLAALAMEQLFLPDTAQVRSALVAEAMDLARAHCTEEGLQSLLHVVHVAIEQPENTHWRDEIGEELVAIAERRGDPGDLARALCARASTYGELARWTAARDDLTRAHELARQHHEVASRLISGWGLSMMRFAEGDVEGAEAGLVPLVALQASVSMPGAGLDLCQLATARYAAGRLPELTDVFASAMLVVPEFHDLHALSLALGGRVDEARALIGSWANQPPLHRDYLWELLTVVRALLWLELGDREALHALRDELAPFADRITVGGMSAGSLGSVSLTLGRLELALGDTAAGLTHLQSALDVHERLGLVPWADLARDCLAAAQVTTESELF
ncbi:BTAD domain-containing putative transcriptional regulator [Angustibacter luteus]|uniref:BTAD domain-containing putative transcriptional regulator n=1 Tax=Angustibacter luteus TaxID=658456 RepID=A0ABW1JEU9_9ACTN